MTNTAPTPITVAYGDGIGPEIMEATLSILDAAGARLDIDTINIGEQLYKNGHSSGIEPGAWESIRRTRVFLKAPITTPTGKGVKSLNVTVRKSLSLFANIRPVTSLHPFVKTNHAKMDVVIVRENEEDLYAGIEHRQTREVAQCLKLISRPGTERIVRYAFEYARAAGRKKVTVMVKDNIMKVTDGLFFQVFDEIAAHYPDIQAERKIIDIGCALLADRPQDFDVVLAPNLYGDILSDVAAQIAGSVGLAGSANIGPRAAMFEAVHGSAPDIAGQGIANPSGLLQGAVLMLNHIGQPEVASRVQNAWLRTIEDGVHTGDIYDAATSTTRVGTSDFARAVIERLDARPEKLSEVDYRGGAFIWEDNFSDREEAKELVGVDVFADWDQHGRDPNVLAEKLLAASNDALELLMITNRGVKVWPDGFDETFKTDHWRCRFKNPKGGDVNARDVIALLGRIVDQGVDVIKTENLYTFDGKPGFSLGQGQ